MTGQCRGSEDTCVLLCVTVAAATAAADDDNDVSIRIRTVQYSTHITAP